MKAGIILGIGILAAILLVKGKLGGLDITKAAPGAMTPTAPATTQTGTSPKTEATQASIPRKLIFEVPPPDVQTHYLGAGMLYAKFETPFDVGGGLKQWGVTAQGAPVVCTNPPETYSDYEWM